MRSPFKDSQQRPIQSERPSSKSSIKRIEPIVWLTNANQRRHKMAHDNKHTHTHTGWNKSSRKKGSNAHSKPSIQHTQNIIRTRLHKQIHTYMCVHSWNYTFSNGDIRQCIDSIQIWVIFSPIPIPRPRISNRMSETCSLNTSNRP